jgi:putative restriction endonuclease
MFYWVNQGKTYREEKEGGYLWAPLKNQSGNQLFHWDNMNKIIPGDIIFNYRKGVICGYCIAKSYAYKSRQPKEFSEDLGWEEDGRMIDAKYYVGPSNIAVSEIYDSLKGLLPEKYNPLNISYINGIPRVKANQGYLYELNQSSGDYLLNKWNISIIETDSDRDTINVEDYLPPTITEKEGLVNSRVGQGKYRRSILHRWKNKCAVTGLSNKELLIASHIVPWREATDFERLDVHNGILLSPVYDALFDKNLISFSDNGQIILTPGLSTDDFKKIGVTGKEKIDGLTEMNKEYLSRHRKKILKND